MMSVNVGRSSIPKYILNVFLDLIEENVQHNYANYNHPAALITFSATFLCILKIAKNPEIILMEFLNMICFYMKNPVIMLVKTFF